MSATITPQGCTNFKLRQLTRRVTRHFDAELARAGLKTTQYSLLSHVLRMGPLRPVDLARAMGVMPSTLTRNLQPMLVAGWLTMEEGADARSRLISLTDAGRDMRAQAQRSWRSAQNKLNAVLGEARVAALHALIDESMVLLADDESTGDDHV